MTTQDLINTLQQGCAITPRLARKIVERLSEQEYIISEIRVVTALSDAPMVELPSMIENLLSELADRQIRRDIEPDEFDVAAYAKAEARTQRVAEEFAFPFHTTLPVGDPEDDEWDPEVVVAPRSNA